MSSPPPPPPPAPQQLATPVTDAILAFAERHRKLLFTLVIVFYLAGFNGVYRPEPDSGLYMSIGRNISRGLGFTYQGNVDQQAYPGFPYLLAASFKLFSPNNLVVPHAIVLLFTFATILLTYAFLRLHASRALSTLVTVNVGFAATLYVHAYQLRNDIPFLMGVMAFLTGYEAVARRGRDRHLPRPPILGLSDPVTPWLLMVLGLAIAVVMRPAMLALVAAIVLASLWNVFRRTARKRLVYSALAMGAVLVAGFYFADPRRYAHHAPGTMAVGEYERIAITWIASPSRFFGRLLSLSTIELFTRSTVDAMFGHELGRGVNTVVCILFLAVAFYFLAKRPLWFCYLGATTLMLILMAELDLPNQPGIMGGQLVPRHVLGILPLLIYLWWVIAIWLERKVAAPYGSILAILMAGVALGPNLVKSSETLIRQRIYAYRQAHGTSETRSFEELGALIHSVPPDATIVAPHKRGRPLSFYSDRRVIEAATNLRMSYLKPPVYVLEEAEPSVQSFLQREHLKLSESLAQVPGRIDWRGKMQPPWQLHLTVKVGAGENPRPH